MVDLFISYAREDRDTAAHLAGCLQQHGWSVWWGSRRGYGDREYANAKKAALSEAHAVVVLWSKHSVAVANVLSEASEAMQRHVLIAVTLELGLRPPPDFADVREMRLIEWSGDMTDNAYVALERAIARLVRPTLSEFALSGIAVEPPRARRWPPLSSPGLPLRIYGYALGATMALAVAAVSFSSGSSRDVHTAHFCGAHPGATRGSDLAKRGLCLEHGCGARPASSLRW